MVLALRHRLQHPLRLYRPAQPRPRDVLRRRALWRRPDRSTISAGARRPRFLLGVLVGHCAGARSSGCVALRTTGVAFMIVTMMFAQACYLLIALLRRLHPRRRRHRADAEARRAASRFGTAVRPQRSRDRATIWRSLLFAVALLGDARAGALAVRPRAGRDPRERGPHRHAGLRHLPLQALRARRSPAHRAAAGAAYALLFAYVGSTFASIQYSILPLLWVLLGGAGTVARAVRRHAADVSTSSTSPATTPRPICWSSAWC